MKIITVLLMILLTACSGGMSAEEVKAHEKYCYKNGAKGVNLLISVGTKEVMNLRCVFDGYETASKGEEDETH